MTLLNRINIALKPVLFAAIFELHLHIKKFVIFLVVLILQLFFFSYIQYYFIPNTELPSSVLHFYAGGTYSLYLFLLFAVCFFFSGIICSEFKNKTGSTILPLISKYKLITGKYLANLIFVIGLTLIYYLILMLLGYNFYGEPVSPRLILSFGFSVLYILALCSFVTFFSSFMPSPSSIIILFIGFFTFYIDGTINNLVMETTGLEPLYSLSYLFEIIPHIFFPSFPKNRYSIISDGNETYKYWYYPNAEGSLITLSLYAVIFFILALIIFKRKELH